MPAPRRDFPQIAAVARIYDADDGRLLTMQQAREGEHTTLTKVSIATGISAPHLSEIERGLRLPTPLECAALEAYYQARLCYQLVPYLVPADGREEVE